MRRLAIHHLLPILFAAVPVVAAGLVFAAVPPDARGHYLKRLPDSPIDWVIIGIGSILFVTQTILAWKALRWQVNGFDERPDHWLTHLAQAAEWFPLLGLIGTVAAILQTFSAIVPGTQPDASSIIKNYAPAITATGSGLFMALANILPAWMVVTGRDLIRSLAGDSTAPAQIVPLTPATPAPPEPVTVNARGAR